MRWLWRGAVLFVGGLLSLFFIMLGMSQPIGEGCEIFGCPPDPPLASVASQIRLIDCTSVDLSSGPYLPASVQSEVVRRVQASGPVRTPLSTWDRTISGELLYSPNGELQSVFVQPWIPSNGIRHVSEPLPRFEISADLEVFYPLKSRDPMAACDSPTLVTFHCGSNGSPCSLSAAPA